MLARFAQFALMAWMLAPLAAAQIPSSVKAADPDLPTIVTRMMETQKQNKDSSRAIVVRRDYQLLDKTYEQKARVIANVTYLPPDHKQYEVESSHGGMGEKILRDVLDHETEKKDERIPHAENSPVTITPSRLRARKTWTAVNVLCCRLIRDMTTKTCCAVECGLTQKTSTSVAWKEI